MEKGAWVDVHPIASVSDIGPIESEFEGKQQKFLDLAHTFLYVTVQLVKSDGSEIDGGSKVSPMNFFLHSLFGQLDIDLNGRTISDGSSTYPHRAYLKTLLSYAVGKMDEPNPTKANVDADPGLKKPASFTSENKEVDMIGRLHGDIFNQEKYLKLELQFGSALIQAVNIIVYADLIF